MVSALGGAGNLLEIDACTTRLRLRIFDQEQVDEATLKSLGAAGVMRPTADTVQVIIGLRADEIATNMLKVTGSIRPSDRAGTSAQPQEASPETGGMPVSAAPYLLAALGGAANVVRVEVFGPRISFLLKDVKAIDAETLRTNGFRGHADLGGGRVQVIADDDLNLLAEALKQSL